MKIERLKERWLCVGIMKGIDFPNSQLPASFDLLPGQTSTRHPDHLEALRREAQNLGSLRATHPAFAVLYLPLQERGAAGPAISGL